MQRFFLAVLIAGLLLSVAGPAGATLSELPSRDLATVAAPAQRLNSDQAKLAKALAAHAGWSALSTDCARFAKDTLSVAGGASPANKALAQAWRTMLAGTLAYADACALWAQTSGAQKAGRVATTRAQLVGAVKAWNEAVSTGGASVATTTTTTPPGATTTTTTTAPAPPTPAQFEASCSELMPYSELDQGLDSLDGVCITEQAQVAQYDSQTGTTTMLVNVTDDGGGNWSGLVAVNLASASQGTGITEGDIIQFWGPVSGSATLTNSDGSSTTIPLVDATYLTVVSSSGG